ncbi:DUF2922 family protein [Enterococcus hulanensis]|uniref:DUF2922 family protein n=1 Tax=Enterococcus hulanensis TaxID=2559929 RepID=UPI0028902CE1|nr:DUF2922 family protein [Enterococcus hulanensis]MDT2660449.1 DUF2922 family protein [Enterococcus hulanensis]
MRKVVAVFENSLGKKHHWSMDEPASNKSPKEIKAALEKITKMSLFEKGTTRLFQKVVGAKFVEVTETTIFGEVDEAVMPEWSAQFAADTISAYKIEENSTLEVSKKGFTIRIADEGEAGITQMELDFPAEADILTMSEAELTAMVAEALPEQTVLKGISYEELEKPALASLIAEASEGENVVCTEIKEELKAKKDDQEIVKKRRSKPINHKLLERFNKYKPKE